MSEIYQLPENGNNNGNATSHFLFQSVSVVWVVAFLAATMVYLVIERIFDIRHVFLQCCRFTHKTRKESLERKFDA